MAEDTMLNEAIQAARDGKRSRARDLLTRLLRTNQSNTDYWLWMSSVVDTQKEQIYCLKSVLRLDAANQVAKRGLILLGEAIPDEVIPVPPSRMKDWEVAEIENPGPTGLAGLLANPVMRIIAFVAIGVILVGLILAGYYGTTRTLRTRNLAALYVRQTLTARPSPTLTIEPTITTTPRFVSPTPTFARPTPLALLLEATYTPTPIYVNTPHTSTEAYRAGIRAYERGQWTAVVNFMQQVIDMEPDAADVFYLIGEAYRFQGEYFSALQAYNDAIRANGNFGPAYLGRARARIAIDPENNVLEDLEEASDLDPDLGEAYLEKARVLINRNQPEAALEELNIAEMISPESPLVFLYRAQAYLDLENYTEARKAAQKANDLDITLLPAYLYLGQAEQGLGKPQQAVNLLYMYTLYEKDDALAWLALGNAYQDLKDNKNALDAYDEALELDPTLIEIYLQRGALYLALGDEENALDQLETALRFRPNSFEVNLVLGKAFYSLEEYGNAYVRFNETIGLAEEDEEFAVLYYWRAQSLEYLNEPEAATRDWQALLALPEDAYPQEWGAIAEEHIRLLNPTETPTPTSTPLESPTPTSTLTETSTPTSTATPRPTRTPTPSPTTPPTRTPSSTP